MSDAAALATLSDAPAYKESGFAVRGSTIRRHDEEGFAGMRRAGRLVAECLDMLVPEVKPGVTTAALDALVQDFILDHGAVPATVGYQGYRHSSCISLNHVICHGIPNDRPLRASDILNIDVTLILDGWHGDHSRMYAPAPPKRKAERLMRTTHQAMMAGIAAVRPGARLGDIGGAITEVARKERFSVVEAFAGHGIGRLFHDEPSVVHNDEAGTGPVLEPGMFFTVEPMLNAGKAAHRISDKDGWTASTRDRQLSAQFEHTVGVTQDGAEIFTRSPAGLDRPYEHAPG